MRAVFHFSEYDNCCVHIGLGLALDELLPVVITDIQMAAYDGNGESHVFRSFLVVHGAARCDCHDEQKKTKNRGKYSKYSFQAHIVFRIWVIFSFVMISVDEMRTSFNPILSRIESFSLSLLVWISEFW